MPLLLADDTGVAIISLVFLVGGYLVVAALFYVMVFRPSRQARREAEAQAARSDPEQEPEHGPEPPAAP